MSSLRKLLLGAAAGVALIAGANGEAAAGPLISGTATFNTTSIGGSGAGSTFQADEITVTANDSVQFQNGGNSFTQLGAATVNSFSLGGNTVFANGGLGVGYSIFLTLNATGVFTGTNAGIRSYGLTSLNFTVFADVGANATLTGTTVNLNGGTKVQLADGALIGGLTGVSVAGGPFLNSLETFNVCTGAGTDSGGTAAGAGCSGNENAIGKFFQDPIPFFNVAFDNFNANPLNVKSDGSAGGTQNGTLIIQGQTGNINFPVPEPGILAVFGVGLVGLGVMRRRQKAA
jgi:hypothetical protein